MQLQDSHRSNKIKTLIDEAPTLNGKCVIAKISAQEVKNWMALGRRFCLENKIHWKSFSRYVVNKNTLHPSILEGVRKRMQDKQLEALAAWSISTFIEQTILEMLPMEEKYDVMQARIFDKHGLELDGDSGNVRYMRAHLNEDATQLIYCHPYYQQAKEDGGGFVKAQAFKIIFTMIKTQLAILIVSKAGYRADLNETFNRKTPSKT